MESPQSPGRLVGTVLSGPNEEFKTIRVFWGRQQSFLYWGMEGVPPPLAKNYSSLPPGKVSSTQ